MFLRLASATSSTPVSTLCRITTRSLLKENEQLRRDLDLLETGQRIATTLDKERLCVTATQAFVQVPLAPNQSVVYHETWQQRDVQGRPVPPGDYQLAGYLTTYQMQSPRDQAAIRIVK